MKKANIVWPTEKRVGRINGKTFSAVWKEIQKKTDQYMEEKWSQLLAAAPAEKKEIEEAWNKMSKSQKEKVERVKVIH